MTGLFGLIITISLRHKTNSCLVNYGHPPPPPNDNAWLQLCTISCSYTGC